MNNNDLFGTQSICRLLLIKQSYIHYCVVNCICHPNLFLDSKIIGNLNKASVRPVHLKWKHNRETYELDVLKNHRRQILIQYQKIWLSNLILIKCSKLLSYRYLKLIAKEELKLIGFYGMIQIEVVILKRVCSLLQTLACIHHLFYFRIIIFLFEWIPHGVWLLPYFVFTFYLLHYPQDGRRVPNVRFVHQPWPTVAHFLW